MVRVEILARKDNANDIVTKLLKIGAFEAEEPRTPISQEKIEEARRKLGEVNENINKIKIIMELGGIEIEPRGKLKVSDWLTVSDEVNKDFSKIEEKYKDLLEEIGKLKAELESLNLQVLELEPFKDIGVSLELLYYTEHFEVALAMINNAQKNEIEKNPNVAIACNQLDENKNACIIASPKGTGLDIKLKELGIRKLETPDLISPQEAYANIQEKINYLQSLLGERRKELISKIEQDRGWIAETYGRLLTVRDAITILSKSRVSEFYIQIEGYLREKKLKRLLEELDKVAFVVYEYPKRYAEQEEPPTYVNLPKSIRPLESVVELYGVPSYWEISPTIFLIITFPLLFGLMFPDFGNALVIFLFSIWFYNYGKKKGSNNIRQLSLVLIYGSIIAMITGLLAREFFGPLAVGGLRELLDNPSYPPGPLYSIWPVPESVYQQIKYILPTGGAEQGIVNSIILSLLLGSVLLFVSSVLGVVNAIKKKDSEYLILDRLPILLIYTVPFIVFTYGLTDLPNYIGQVESLLGGFGYFLFHTGTPAPGSTQTLADILVIWVELALIYNWAGKVVILRRHEKMSAVGAIVFGFIEGGFEAGILLLSNTISFIRVLVFAVAHYYILYAFSYMGYLAAGYPSTVIGLLTNPIAIIIIIIGNLLAIALEGLIVFIQDMRLHFYEMFSKFYEGRGRKFEPQVAYIEILS
ncbi:V-type ATP synthase subunit I [Stygiolobus caldivivus]|uniref:A-type ATP synthase subunit I n=1 Tax=Stygiolobus caldivivus TaxID=2824673 RepID=A0A8D5U8G2_9CREN|nr:V-type ATP synthase subunit I [Stygiolobus caldivivus]BCU71329.1 ATP synthase subunit I [Stygiolobus caldivivus]